MRVIYRAILERVRNCKCESTCSKKQIYFPKKNIAGQSNKTNKKKNLKHQFSTKYRSIDNKSNTNSLATLVLEPYRNILYILLDQQRSPHPRGDQMYQIYQSWPGPNASASATGSNIDLQLVHGSYLWESICRLQSPGCRGQIWSADRHACPDEVEFLIWPTCQIMEVGGEGNSSALSSFCLDARRCWTSSCWKIGGASVSDIYKKYRFWLCYLIT